MPQRVLGESNVVPINPKLDIRPVRDWILLKERPRGITPGGIIVPETNNSPRLAAWEVVAVGPGVRDATGVLRPVSVVVGDCVVVQPAHCMRAPVEGQLHALIQEFGIVAVVQGDSFGRAGIIEGLDGCLE